jgi:hypothetical protein
VKPSAVRTVWRLQASQSNKSYPLSSKIFPRLRLIRTLSYSKNGSAHGAMRGAQIFLTVSNVYNPHTVAHNRESTGARAPERACAPPSSETLASIFFRLPILLAELSNESISFLR